ncbi:MAG: hypothetical protein M1836_006027 [Candelina mexicana]|nr:MAG: hypothetical protein M1836_006027 [Candelina mexicana]
MTDFWDELGVSSSKKPKVKKKRGIALGGDNLSISTNRKALDGKAVAESTLSDLLSSNASLFESGEHSDLTIVCDESQFKVHRAIVGPRSKALGRMCQQGDGAFEEALTGRIHLKHDDPMIVEKMLSFLYRLDYSDDAPYEDWQAKTSNLFAPSKVALDRQAAEGTQTNGIEDWKEGPPPPAPEVPMPAQEEDPPAAEPSSENEAVPIAELVASDENDESDKLTPLVLNARVYTIAEKYDIWALKKLAQHKFEERVTGNGWNDEGFSLAIREVFEWTTDKDKGLRRVLVRVAAENVTVLCDRGEFKSVLDDIPDFTRRLLDEVVKRKSLVKDLWCASCQELK